MMMNWEGSLLLLLKQTLRDEVLPVSEASWEGHLFRLLIGSIANHARAEPNDASLETWILNATKLDYLQAEASGAHLGCEVEEAFP
jgi:hypothetical protein